MAHSRAATSEKRRDQEPRKTYRFRIGSRQLAAERAWQLGVSRWVRNREDGSAEGAASEEMIEPGLLVRRP